MCRYLQHVKSALCSSLSANPHFFFMLQWQFPQLSLFPRIIASIFCPLWSCSLPASLFVLAPQIHPYCISSSLCCASGFWTPKALTSLRRSFSSSFSASPRLACNSNGSGVAVGRVWQLGMFEMCACLCSAARLPLPRFPLIHQHASHSTIKCHEDWSLLACPAAAAGPHACYPCGPETFVG